MKITIEVQSDANFDTEYFMEWLNLMQRSNPKYSGLSSSITEVNGKKIEKLYGLYSGTQSKESGIFVYTNKFGDLVHVTEVNNDPNHVGCHNDVIKVGEVCRFVRRFIYYGFTKA